MHMTFSAKDLVSRSCSQIKLFMDYPEKRPQPSGDMLYGEKFQKAVANTIPNIIGEEMRGVYTNGGISIYFSNDIVCNNKIIEVKSVVGSAPDWYFKSALIQCAFYKAMIMQGFNRLETASFYVNLGNEYKATIVPNYIDYFLIFGEKKYKIEVDSPNAIINFFLEKAMACTDWDLAKSFDFANKHMEFDKLKKYFRYYSVF